VAAYVLVLVVGLAAGTVSAIIGTGASMMLLPVLVIEFGPKQAVPIMAVASVMANLAKMMSWWREVDWRATAAYAAAGIPAASLGARTLLALPSSAVDVALGLFFLAMIPGRRALAARNLTLSLWQLAFAGAVIGYLTGIVVSTGPLSVPAFIAYGLSKGAFLSTEAAASLGLYVGKIATFRSFGALPWDATLKGLIVGGSLMVGSFAGRLVVLRLSTSAFQHLLDGLMLASGLTLLWAAVTG
jgi:uncharacterized membrane protein YfcA